MFTQKEVNFLLELYEKNTSSVVSADEFRSDVKKFEEIYKALKTYDKKGEMNVRFVLNNFIILENVFGPVAIGMLIRYCPQDSKPYLYAVMEYAGRLPIHLRESVDKMILEEIRKL